MEYFDSPSIHPFDFSNSYYVGYVLDNSTFKSAPKPHNWLNFAKSP